MAIKIETENPVSQTVDAVRELLSYMHRPAEPLPEFVELNDRVRLTLSKDGKAYYLTTARACSCPANTFHPGQRCKHMRALQATIEEREDDSILPAMSQQFRPTSDDDIPRRLSRPAQDRMPMFGVEYTHNGAAQKAVITANTAEEAETKVRRLNPEAHVHRVYPHVPIGEVM